MSARAGLPSQQSFRVAASAYRAALNGYKSWIKIEQKGLWSYLTYCRQNMSDFWYNLLFNLLTKILLTNSMQMLSDSKFGFQDLRFCCWKTSDWCAQDPEDLQIVQMIRWSHWWYDDLDDLDDLNDLCSISRRSPRESLLERSANPGVFLTGSPEHQQEGKEHLWRKCQVAELTKLTHGDRSH